MTNGSPFRAADWLNCLCFSKDRPLQLDGYLRSLRLMLDASLPVTVLYRASSAYYAEDYEELKRTYPAVAFVPETDFGAQVCDWVQTSQVPLVLFGCDDVVFYRPLDLRRAVLAFEDADLLGFSLRLGRNILYSQSRPEPVAPPPFTATGEILKWNWRGADGEWGYPFELDGTVYRRGMLAAVLTAMEQYRARTPAWDWRHPNLLEMNGNVFIKAMDILPGMASFPASCLIVPTVNRVQDYFQNPLLGRAYTTQELEELWRRRQIMDVSEFQKQPYDRVHVGNFYLTGRNP